MTSYIIQNTLHKEIETRLKESATVYFEELDTIEKKCIDIVSVYSRIPTIVKYITEKDYARLESNIVQFYKMNLVDIIEIEDSEGKVLFRGHNPDLAGDIKIDQDVVKEGLAGNISLSYEHGHSGFAIRAVAPIFSENRVIGLFMAGSLFSKDFVNRMKSLTLLENGIYKGNSKLISTYRGMDKLDPEDVGKLKTGSSIIKLNTALESGVYHTIIKPIFLNNSYWGAIMLGMSKQEVEKTYNYANTQMTYVVILGLFIAVLVYTFLARNINSSISRIITGISNFNFDGPNELIRTDKGDEFGIIAERYNLLIERLDLYNQRIQRLQNDLVESTRLATAGQVAASLAHEIRNPLSSIKMMSQIIRSRYLCKDKGQDEMSIILEEIDRINSKVSELLEFAKPSKMEMALYDVHEIIEGVINLCIYTAGEKGITFKREYLQNAPKVTADAEKLRICFLNIILNAVHIMAKGGEIVISTDAEKGNFYTKICNTGSTIAPEEKDKLFLPFYTKREGGTGLGLAISRLIAERHGGAIKVNSDGGMVCFCITIPFNSKLGGINSGFNSGNR